jgi:hypothetical protein
MIRSSLLLWEMLSNGKLVRYHAKRKAAVRLAYMPFALGTGVAIVKAVMCHGTLSQALIVE